MQAPMCRDCFAGTLRGDATPAGTEETIHGVPTYVARPAPGVEPLGTVVILTDAFGWKLRNTRALADAYAQRVPCTVYVPDFMNGHAIPEHVLSLTEAKPPPTAWFVTRALHKIFTTLSLVPLLLRFLFHNRQAVAHPRVLSFMTALRGNGTDNKVGVAGFCWGGLHAVLLTHDTPQNTTVAVHDGVRRPLIDCAFTAHPSLLSVPAHIEGVVRPLSVANGEDDQYMGREKMQKLKGIMEGKNGEGGGGGGGEEKYEVVVYPGAKHGFAVRGDRDDPLQRERGEQSEEQAVRWFRRWFAEEG
ncbi:protein AIM2 [Chaetomidium leptoderma]|uniref:Protein AIM2 n=1 Tax=Chaetomidium leptoderma TaxID=669021 RepID=A0AAN6VI00_9PEZI|nr:protein AIM2 [Chaetomidium leptoderma]